MLYELVDALLDAQSGKQLVEALNALERAGVSRTMARALASKRRRQREKLSTLNITATTETVSAIDTSNVDDS